MSIPWRRTLRSGEGELLEDTPAVWRFLLHERRFADSAADWEERLDSFLRLLQRDRMVAFEAAQRAVRSRLVARAAVRRVVRVRRPQGSHRGSQLVVGFGDRVGDYAWELGYPRQLEVNDERPAKNSRAPSISAPVSRSSGIHGYSSVRESGIRSGIRS